MAPYPDGWLRIDFGGILYYRRQIEPAGDRRLLAEAILSLPSETVMMYESTAPDHGLSEDVIVSQVIYRPSTREAVIS